MGFTKFKPISTVKKAIILFRRRKTLILLSGIVGVLLLLKLNRAPELQLRQNESNSTTNVIMMNTVGHKKHIRNGVPEPVTTETRSTIEELNIANQSVKSSFGLTTHTQKPVVLIITYMRSGSSIIAYLLARGSGAFLYYEPLQDLSKLKNGNQILNLTSGESKLFVKEKFPDVAEEVMGSYLRCKIDHSYCEGYTDSFLQMEHSKLFATCIKTMKRDQAPCPEYLPCQMILKHECISSKYVVMKTTQAPMNVVRYLFPIVPNLRVIHLTRDARATIKSQIKYGLAKGIDTSNFIFSFCQRVLDDIQSKIEIEEEFPGRILQIKYEDFSLNPIKTLQQMYAFAGTNITEEIAEYAWDVTYKRHKCQGFVCTKQANATSLMSAWRTTIPYNLVKIIDEKCIDVYRYLGYLSTKNEKVLRNLKKSLTLPNTFDL